MKTILSAPLALLASAIPAFSITIDQLAPAALAGKTLQCTIDYSAAPFATTGTWTGTFETSPANGFTIHKVTGNTVDGSGTVTYKDFSFDVYIYTINPYLAGQGPCSLYLWVVDGVAHYELELMNGSVYVASEGGTFVFGSPPKVADIDLQQPAGSSLTDGKSKKSFGTTKIGGKGVSKTFTIKNRGKAQLTGLSIKTTGVNKKDFVVGKPGKTGLAAGASTTFKVTFKPTAKGARSASLAISSNDPDESPFDITLAGQGVK